MQPARWLWKGLLLLAALGSMAATRSTDTTPSTFQTKPTTGVSAGKTAETPSLLLINEIDAIAASEAAEFIELYDGGVGNTPLDGLSLVLYRGDEATVYGAIGLDGHTDSRGYYVIGGPAIDADHPVAAGLLRDGPDAVALYAAWPWQFPVGSPVVTEGLLDAVVYAPGAAPVAGLQPLLLPDELPLDEAQQGTAAAHSAQRYPNGGGEARQTSAFIVAPPTPSEPNATVFDATPFVTEVWPADDATGVNTPVTLVVTFSEPVALDATPLDIQCAYSGGYPYTLNGGPVTFRFRPYVPIAAGDTCQVLVYKDRVHDLDSNDPPDIMGIDAKWNFTTAPAVAQNIVLNEIDTDTPGTDTAEFIELFDGGTGATPLDGLLLVLFNGGDDRSYRTIDLAGQTTDAAGYWLAGNAAIAGAEMELPDGALQNGTDAVALVAGRAEAFPNGTPVDGITPQDAVVYGQSDEPDVGLLSLLNEGQPAIDENGRGEAENHSNQRCPNGTGGARNTGSFRQNGPTPRAGNDCQTDTAPIVTERTPTPGAGDVAIGVALGVTFSEPVALSNGWLTLACTLSGAHPYTVAGGPSTFTAQPSAPFAYAETCTATLKAAKIRDLDSDDPPDSPDGNLTWKFTTAAAPADFVLINETDADTPGSDTAEFVELYNGGVGRTDLSGLVLVFYNGSTNTTYAAFDLDDQHTDAAGYWLAGDAAINPDLTFANGALQNGPDAVALYAGDATQFPANTPLHTRGLVDAVVYGDVTSAPELLALLLAGESAADEGARGAADAHALQRCPNGAGGQRRTAALRPGPPTPGAPSNCAVDAAPNVVSVLPANASDGIAVTSTLTVTFNEPVTPAAGWLRLNCAANDYAMTIASVDATTYKATPTALLPPATTCQATIAAALVHDADSDDPPDTLAADYSWSFATAAPVANFVLINELDSDTPGSDTAEFVELYDDGTGGTDLSGLVLVFFNGSDDRSYYAVDLDGATTDGDGYAVIGSAALAGAVTLPASAIQNGPDAVALYEGDAGDFPNGAALTTSGLRDALVYSTSDPTDNGLLALLTAGQEQVDENARAAAETDSSGRCPNASGGLRQTASYRPNPPTPGAPNDCRADAAPAVAAVSPADGAEHVAVSARLQVQFSEAVTLDSDWFAITCDASGTHAAATEGGPAAYILTPVLPFTAGEACTVTLRAAAVRDADRDDPPDGLAADYAWRFRIAPAAVDGILINEVDSDTPGQDTAEFIELYDGGRGHVDLSGLIVVLWNGSDDTAYEAIDLGGQQTDAGGYFVLGGGALPGADWPLADAALQNGPDAITLHDADADAFPPGAPLITTGLRDAVVYGPADDPDGGLLALLAAGQSQVDEAGQGDASAHSLQRCPNGDGGPRHTANIRAAAPSPGTPNPCPMDAPPAVSVVSPALGAVDVPLTTTLVITFTEAVTFSSDWFTLTCDGHEQAVTTLPGETQATVVPGAALPEGAVCVATIAADSIHDTDPDDPPDTLPANFTWAFTTPPARPPLIASFTSNSPVWVDAPVVFTNTTTGPGTPAYLWDFGDGHGSTQPSPSHRYAAPGTYTVTLTAATGQTATYSATILVRPRRAFAPLALAP